jgi:bifunctional polynucleotide phosphatase/kinase
LYVGDGAGRKKDFSDSDYKFALNVGVPFETPEKFFESSNEDKNQTSNLPLPIHPIKSICNDNTNFWKEYDNIINNNFNGLIIMIGSQASGKTTFVKKKILNKFPNFVHVSLDQIKSINKLIKIVSEELKNNNTVIIDNTNYDKNKRLVWLNLGKSLNKPIVGIFMNIDKEIALHMNTYRSCKKIASCDDKIIPDVAIHKYYKNFEEPSINEGFNNLLVYNFNLETDNDIDKENILIFLK